MRRLFLLSICFFFFACNEKLDKVEIKDEQDRLIVEYTRRKSDFARQGTFKAYNENGVVIEEAEYDNDLLHGKRKLFYDSGEVMIEENYVQGQFQDWYRSFYENGQVELEGKYIDNSMEGEWKRYFEGGQIMETVLFSGNQENGPFVEYHQNGQLKFEGTYKDGDNEHGELKEYDEAGTLIRRMTCDMGLCRTVWTLEEGDVKPVDDPREKI